MWPVMIAAIEPSHGTSVQRAGGGRATTAGCWCGDGYVPAGAGWSVRLRSRNVSLGERQRAKGCVLVWRRSDLPGSEPDRGADGSSPAEGARFGAEVPVSRCDAAAERPREELLGRARRLVKIDADRPCGTAFASRCSSGSEGQRSGSAPKVSCWPPRRC